MRARLNEILIELNRRNLLTKSMLIRMCEQNPEIGAYYAAYVLNLRSADVYRWVLQHRSKS